MRKHLWFSLAPNKTMVLGQVVRKFLIGSLLQRSIFPQVRCQVCVRLSNGRVCCLCYKTICYISKTVRHGTGWLIAQHRFEGDMFQTHTLPGCWQVLSPTRKETSSEACQGRVRFQQHRDASCHQVFFPPPRQGAEGNSCHSDRNISLFPSWLTKDLLAPLYKLGIYIK